MSQLTRPPTAPHGVAATAPASYPNRARLGRPISRDELGNTPTIVGREDAVKFCNDVLGVPISFTRMRRGFERRELTVWKVGGMNATSPQALFDWIQGMARPALSQREASA